MQVYDCLEGEFIETITAGVNPSEKNVPPFNLRIHMDSSNQTLTWIPPNHLFHTDYIWGTVVHSVPGTKARKPCVHDLRTHTSVFTLSFHSISVCRLSPQLLCYHNSYLPLKPADLMHAWAFLIIPNPSHFQTWSNVITGALRPLNLQPMVTIKGSLSM